MVYYWQPGSSHNFLVYGTASGYQFQYWQLDGSVYTYSSSFSYVINGPHTFVAVFNGLGGGQGVPVTVNSIPFGGYNIIQVDGNPISPPYTFYWQVGSTHFLQATGSVGGLYFQYWSVDGIQYTPESSFIYQVDGPHTITAVFLTQTTTYPSSTFAFSINTPSCTPYGSVTQGGSIACSFQVAWIQGTQQPVTLTLMNQPSGTTLSWSPSSTITPSASEELTIQTTCSTPAQSYSNLQVTGSGGGASASSPQFSLTVVASSSCSASTTLPGSSALIPFDGMELRYYSATTPILLQRTGLSASGWITLLFHDVSSTSSKMDVTFDGNVTQNGHQTPLKVSQTVDFPTNQDTLVFLRNGGQNSLTIFAGSAGATIAGMPGYSFNLTRQWTLYDEPLLRTNLTTQGSFTTYRYHTSIKSVSTPVGPVDLDFYAYYENRTKVLVYGEVWATVGGFTDVIEKVTLAQTNMQFTTSTPQCIIATAAYGSALAGPVQFLRGFRDNDVQSTGIGRAFMQAFNNWYYSWAPPIAQTISGSEPLEATVRAIISPLIGALFVSDTIFHSLVGLSPDVAVLIAGITASALIGAIYLTIPIYLILRRRRITKTTLICLMAIGFALSLYGTFSNRTTGLLENLSSILVVETVLLAPTFSVMIIKQTTSRLKTRTIPLLTRIPQQARKSPSPFS